MNTESSNLKISKKPPKFYETLKIMCDFFKLIDK